MKILILNAGSSSLKYQLMDMDGEKILAKGIVDRIGIPGSAIKQTVGDQVYTLSEPIPKHTDAIRLMLKALMDPEKGAIQNLDEIAAFGHRVLHGGEKFTGSILVTDEVKATIREYFPLGPLHNPPNLMGIEACQEAMPGMPNVAVFDTSFHQTMPKKAFLYGIPQDYYKRLQIRRYGFHGTSHRYVSKRVREFLDMPRDGSRIITCHLGNGSSLAAVKDGKCVDTSMGLTPLEGVIMGTRSGNLDPAVVQFIANSDNMTVDEVINICNKKSGLIGISGISSDMRDIDAAAEKGDENAILAQEMLVHSIRKYIGAYAAVLGGVDVIVFTAGIGENNTDIRLQIMEGFEYLGAKIDPEKNKTRSEAVVSTDDSKVKICVIPTNEELVIARDTLAIVTGKEISD
ncbi:MAG TPA: acetate kinase [Candidatus Limiplasma sp.]|nr:acetate kinase [Candidatus Limiplasma sp.]HRX09736.1 acetate kinase [Candidatus Limiplasma sp.]